MVAVAGMLAFFDDFERRCGARLKDGDVWALGNMREARVSYSSYTVNGESSYRGHSDFIIGCLLVRPAKPEIDTATHRSPAP
jgi:hypothetical protein